MNPEGTFPFEAKRALVQLLRGPVVSHDAHRQQWSAILAHRNEIERRLADVFLDLVLDEDDGDGRSLQSSGVGPAAKVESAKNMTAWSDLLRQANAGDVFMLGRAGVIDVGERPPCAYRRAVRLLGEAGLVERSRIVMEKPFGTDLASDLGLTVGDKLRVTSATGRSETLDITGLFDMGNRDLNRRWVFVTLKLAQSLLDLPGGVSNIDLTVRDLFGADAVANTLRAQTGLTVDSWMQTNSGLLNALSNQTVSNNLIRSFVVIIVALGIASVLIVSVVQKSREIGVLRAVGTQSSMILRIFLIQGGLVGFLGSVIGALLGVGLARLFAGMQTNADGSAMFPATVDAPLFFGSIGLATLVGLLAAVAPARRASRLEPAQVIRYG